MNGKKPMNTVVGWCSTNGANTDNFQIGTDEEGNSLLTGDGKLRDDDNKVFFCVQLEAYSVVF